MHVRQGKARLVVPYIRLPLAFSLSQCLANSHSVTVVSRKVLSSFTLRLSLSSTVRSGRDRQSAQQYQCLLAASKANVSHPTGGVQCAKENPSKQVQPNAVDGLHSDWITPDLLAMARPWQLLVDRYDLPVTMRRQGFGAILCL